MLVCTVGNEKHTDLKVFLRALHMYTDHDTKPPTKPPVAPTKPPTKPPVAPTKPPTVILQIFGICCCHCCTCAGIMFFAPCSYCQRVSSFNHYRRPGVAFFNPLRSAIELVVSFFESQHCQIRLSSSLKHFLRVPKTGICYCFGSENTSK